MKTKLMVVDQEVNFVDEVSKYFKKSGSIEVIKTACKLSETVEYYGECDVLLINMVLDGLESISIIEQYKRFNSEGIVIATSDFITSDLFGMVNKSDVNYFVKKPVSCESLESLILNLRHQTEDTEEKQLKIQITNMLHLLGIPSHIKGYQYIRKGVELLYNDSSANFSGSITRKIYPSIANAFDTTTSRVERAIRHAIEVSWVRGDYKAMERLFGNSVDFDRSKPTNSEFITTLADRLKLEGEFA